MRGKKPNLGQRSRRAGGLSRVANLPVDPIDFSQGNLLIGKLADQMDFEHFHILGILRRYNYAPTYQEFFNGFNVVIPDKQALERVMGERFQMIDRNFVEVLGVSPMWSLLDTAWGTKEKDERLRLFWYLTQKPYFQTLLERRLNISKGWDQYSLDKMNNDADQAYKNDFS